MREKSAPKQLCKIKSLKLAPFAKFEAEQNMCSWILSKIHITNNITFAFITDFAQITTIRQISKCTKEMCKTMQTDRIVGCIPSY